MDFCGLEAWPAVSAANRTQYILHFLHFQRSKCAEKRNRINLNNQLFKVIWGWFINMGAPLYLNEAPRPSPLSHRSGSQAAIQLWISNLRDPHGLGFSWEQPGSDNATRLALFVNRKQFLIEFKHLLRCMMMILQFRLDDSWWFWVSICVNHHISKYISPGS